MKTYDEMMKLKTYDERLEYLHIGDCVGRETFGYDRYINQLLYTDPEWRRTRDKVIIRDNGCDLGVESCEIDTRRYNGTKTKRNILIVHHITPITKEDILDRSSKIFDLNNLVSTSLDTHNKIHYGLREEDSYVERTPNDTCPWKTERR